jgi:glycerol-3-phosphate acyltransferase PlsY
MAFSIATVTVLATAYLLGSIPTAYLAGNLLYGLDIRELGSRSVGATNALCVLGKWPALVVLLVDVLIGVAATGFADGSVLRSRPSHRCPLISKPGHHGLFGLARLAALMGHSRSIWLKFSRGQSVLLAGTESRIRHSLGG